MMEIKIVDRVLEKFLSSLERSTLAKVLRTIDLLEMFGSELGMPHSKKVTGRIFELRVKGRQEVRILYAFHRNQVILLHGFVKKTAKMPQRELKMAVKKWENLTNTLH